jgi:predicted PurR-regulated permease PerM
MKGDVMNITLSEPLGWAIIISIIIIAATILVWLLITIILGSILLKKTAQLTSQINNFTISLQKNSEKISNQLSDSVKLFNQSVEENRNPKFGAFVKGVMGFGVIAAEFFSIYKRFKGGK